jgi:hypothetical protein
LKTAPTMTFLGPRMARTGSSESIKGSLIK